MATANLMKAVTFHEYGEPEVLRLEEVARPAPGPGEVLVRVRAAGVNAIDRMFRAGHLKDFMPLELPEILGFDLAGIVATVGSRVSDFAAGDEVFGRGSSAYAEYATAPAQTIAHKPNSLSFEQAATLAIGGVTAWAGLFDTAHLDAGRRVLIQGGAGGVGNLAVQLAHWKGAYVIATTSAGNVDFVRSLGADEVIDYNATRFEEAVHDLDVVFDAVGGEVKDRSWASLKKGGILVMVAGMPQPEKAEQYGVRTSGVQAPQVTRPILEELLALIAAGRLVPHVQALFPLGDAAKAHALAETGHGRGRIVLQISG